MEERQDELGKTWRQIATDGGISYETVRAVRKGKGAGPIPAPTRRALERGLEWPVRYVDEILAGGVSAGEETKAEPDLRDDVERDLWQLARLRGLGERGAWLLINAYRGDQTRAADSSELPARKTG
jgi:hypothetical protein